MLLTATNVGYTYPDGRKALENIHFNLNKAEIVLVTGPNGSGKTTLLHLLAGILKPSEGELEIKGRAGLVLQSAEDILFGATVEEEISLGLKNAGFSGDEAKTRVKEVMQALDIPDSWLVRSPFSLSGGEMRKVALAAVMALQPSLLLLDEPTVGLDYPGIMALMNSLPKLCAKGIAVVVATHRWEPFLPVTGRLLALEEGTLIYNGEIRGALKKGIIETSWNTLARRLASKGMELPFNALDVEETRQALIKAGGARHGN